MSEIGMASGWKSPRIAEIGGGLVIASYLRKMLTLACVAAVLPACLITDRKDYQAAPSFPPFVVATPASYQLDRLIVLEDVVSPDGGLPELSFDVRVHDRNVNDTLKVRVFVNRRADDTSPDSYRFAELMPDPDSDTPFERPYGFTVATNTAPFRPGDCNKIELLVATDFTDERNFEPVDPNEFARAVWWAGPRAADVGTCNP